MDSPMVMAAILGLSLAMGVLAGELVTFFLGRIATRYEGGALELHYRYCRAPLRFFLPLLFFCSPCVTASFRWLSAKC